MEDAINLALHNALVLLDKSNTSVVRKLTV